ncbi:unnamed protein product [Discosporangium mesarthrocarpum]
MGSIHGCIYGTHCYTNDQCQRKEPEHRGYAAPSIAVILGVLLVGGTAVTCGLATLALATEFAKQSSTPAAVPVYVTLPGESNMDLCLEGEDAGEAQGSDGAAKTWDGGPRRGVRGGRRQLWARGDTSLSPPTTSMGGAGARHGEQGEPSPLGQKVRSCARWFCGSAVALVLVVCAAVVSFAPHAPGVNVCNTQFDWGSIVHSMKKASIEADFQLLVSVYNPNVLDVKLESGTAVLYHKHDEVGTMVFDPVLLQGGYITDILLNIAFNAEAWEDFHIGLEYEMGELAFLMDATISASVLWHGFKTYPFTFNINHYSIKVSDVTNYDRSLCNCPEMMQAAPGTGGNAFPEVLTLSATPDASGDSSELMPVGADSSVGELPLLAMASHD